MVSYHLLAGDAHPSAHARFFGGTLRWVEQHQCRCAQAGSFRPDGSLSVVEIDPGLGVCSGSEGAHEVQGMKSLGDIWLGRCMVWLNFGRYLFEG